MTQFEIKEWNSTNKLNVPAISKQKSIIFYLYISDVVGGWDRIIVTVNFGSKSAVRGRQWGPED